ncbi:MAG: hypothetical protein EOP10_17010 [Proteobacteria bacterium]|nr:MAG: hypothetical protein EOP10_17010 [Pseudomonadota bacterium]
MKVFIHALITLGLSASVINLSACGGGSSSKDAPAPVSDNQIPSTPPVQVEPLPVQGKVVIPLKDRSTETFCEGLSDFLQNYAATKLPGTSLALVVESAKTCREESSPTNLTYHTQIQITHNQNTLNLAINIIAPFKDSTFTAPTILIDRLATHSSSVFVANETDKVFGDLTTFTSELKTFANLTNAPFKIFDLPTANVYTRLLTHFATGNTRTLIDSPKLRVELAQGVLKVKEIAPGYFSSNQTFLRCANLGCLTDGLTYEMQGLDIVLYSKPYAGPNNTKIKAPFKVRITAAHVN